MTNMAYTWVDLDKPKRVWLADDDPALPPEQLMARLKGRAKAARRKERAILLALGLPPEDPPRGGRPTSAAVKSQTLQRRKRKANADAALALVDIELCDFDVVGVEASIGAADRVAEEKAAVEREAAEFAAAEQAAAEHVAVEDAAVNEAIEAAIEAAAADVAAAEIEVAIDQAAVGIVWAMERGAITGAMDDMVATVEARLRLEKRLMREVAPTDTGVAFRPQLQAVAPVHGNACIIDMCHTGKKLGKVFGHMACCGAGICMHCLGKSQAQAGKSLKTHYGGCEKVVPRAVCPACKAPFASIARGGWVRA